MTAELIDYRTTAKSGRRHSFDMRAQKNLNFLEGGGSMGEYIRAFDWAQSPLGPIELWPQSLKTSVSLMLNSQHPMWIGWGPQAIFLYNDAYIQVLSLAKHPWALGKPAAVVWAEIWNICGPLAEKVFQKGEASFLNDVRLFMSRGDFLEETFYSFSYSPIRDESGSVGGLFCPSAEVTSKVLNTRRLQTLSELAAKSLVEKTAAAACSSAAEILAKNPDDIPFMLLYLFDGKSDTAHLAQAVGIRKGLEVSPEFLTPDSSALWPIAEVMKNPQALVLNISRLSGFPLGLAGQNLTEAVVLPVVSGGQERPWAILIVGVNPARKLDAEYLTFFELVAGHVATAIQNARVIEEEKQRADMLAELDRAKTTFFSNVSHEFRTPLTLMLGQLEELLARRQASGSSEERAELEVVHRNSLRLLKLVNTLLDFSRIEAGRAQAVFVETDLAALTADLASVFRAAIEKAGLAFKVDCPPLGRPVSVDTDMWEKIIFNLLSNAFKFTLAGEIGVSLREEKEAAVLKVWDTGIGISPTELPKIFKRFYRIENAQGRSHEGTGIGLALASELVKLHGGAIEVESEQGRGTVFQITIPLAEKRASAVSAETAFGGAEAASQRKLFVEEVSSWLPQNNTSETETVDLSSVNADHDNSLAAKPRILLAEDNADLREYVQRLLQRGYVVEAVSDGAAALAAARKNPPDLVLSDVMMPRLDGFALLRELRDDAALRAIPVILLSARAGEESRLEGTDAGADDYLTKPFSARELCARVNAHVKLARIRKETETRLSAALALREESEAKTRATLESITDGLHVIDAQGRITFFNSTARNLLVQQKLDPQSLLGRPFFDVFPATLEIDVGHALKRTLQERVPTEAESFYTPWQKWFAVRHYPTAEGGVSTFFQDITERKKAQSALQESEQRYRTLFNSMFEGFCIIELIFDQNQRAVDYRFLEVNPAFKTQTGLSDVVGRRMSEIAPNHEKYWLDIYARVALSGEAVRYENWSNKMGRWFEIFAGRIEPADSRRVGIVFNDITPRKKVEEALRESRERLQAALNAAGAGTFRWNILTNSLDWDENLDRLFGLPAHETVRSLPNFVAAVHCDDRARVNEMCRRCAQEGVDFDLPYRVMWRDGSTHWLHGKGKMFFDEAGKPTHITGACLDITQHKQSEITAAENAQRLHLALDAGDLGDWSWDAHTQILTLSARGSEIFGQGKSVTRWNWDDIRALLHPKDQERSKLASQNALKNHADYNIEYQLHHKAAEQCWVATRGRGIYGADGEILGMVGVVQDITERKQAAQALIEARLALAAQNQVLEDTVQQRTAKLKETILELEAFSYSISHDMRAPLRAMQGYSQALLQDCQDKLEPEAAHLLQRIHRAATRLDLLIRDVLSYSRIAKGEVELTPIDVEALIQDIVQNYPNLGPSNIRVNVSPLMPVMAHEALLTQIISNLLGNAVKFSSPDCFPEVRVSGQTLGSEFRLWFEDNGIGIDSKHHDQIFQIFGRIYPEKQYEGTGIGLAIVKKSAERMGGSAGVESALGRGSRFWVTLKRAA